MSYRCNIVSFWYCFRRNFVTWDQAFFLFPAQNVSRKRVAVVGCGMRDAGCGCGMRMRDAGCGRWLASASRRLLPLKFCVERKERLISVFNFLLYICSSFIFIS